MKKTKIIKITDESNKGLMKLKEDIGKGYRWTRKHTKKYLETGRPLDRPRGVPKRKSFEGHPYKFFGSFDNKLSAKEVANEIRYYGNYARIQKYEDKWLVWEGEKY